VQTLKSVSRRPVYIYSIQEITDKIVQGGAVMALTSTLACREPAGEATAELGLERGAGLGEAGEERGAARRLA
jgi:hypothetical protein